MKKQNVETSTVTESRRGAGGGGGDPLFYEIITDALEWLGLSRGDLVEVKPRTEVKPGRLMFFRVNGSITLGRVYPYDCTRLRLEWAGGPGIIRPEHDLQAIGIPVLSTRVPARGAKGKRDMPELPKPKTRRGRGAK